MEYTNQQRNAEKGFFSHKMYCNDKIIFKDLQINTCGFLLVLIKISIGFNEWKIMKRKTH